MKRIALLFCTSLMSLPALASSMDKVLADYGHPVACQSLLIQAADNLIGRNQHRLYIAPEFPISSTPLIDGTIAYKDRSVAIALQAYQDANKECRVTIEQTYLDNSLCTESREDWFSKWDFVGKLSTATRVFKRIEPNEVQYAYLADAMQNVPYCLIHIHQDLNSSALNAK